MKLPWVGNMIAITDCYSHIEHIGLDLQWSVIPHRQYCNQNPHAPWAVLLTETTCRRHAGLMEIQTTSLYVRATVQISSALLAQESLL